jgi:hypothetical protein
VLAAGQVVQRLDELVDVDDLVRDPRPAGRLAKPLSKTRRSTVDVPTPCSAASGSSA